MKALIQRTSRARVSVAGIEIAAISHGLLVFLGIRTGDSVADADALARKTAQLRIFSDCNDRMNRSLLDTGGQALVISQFTLYADTRKGSRPGFSAAAPPGPAEALYLHFVASLANHIGTERVLTGQFRQSMQVELINDGPVTIEICTDS